ADAASYAYQGRPEQKIAEVTAKIRELAKDNPQLAAIMAHNLVEYPSSSRLLDNTLIPAGDILSIFPFGTVGKLLKGRAAEEILTNPPMPLTPSAYAYRPPMPLTPENYGKATEIIAEQATKSAAGSAVKAVSDIGKAVLKPNASIPEILDSAGEVVPSAATSIVDKITQQVTAVSGKSTTLRDLLNEIP